jgi:hypothetical protein
MPENPPRFDQAELERILRRAVELHSDEGDQYFDEGDAVSAGRELGIPDRVTRAAAREVLGPGARKVERPTGATVRIERDDDHISVVAPALGVGGRRGRTLFFGAMWLLAAIVWAAEVSRSSVGLALLAFPFVMLAVVRLGPIIRAALESAELRLDARSGSLVRRLGPLTTRQSLDTAHLTVRLAREADDAVMGTHHHLLLEDRHSRTSVLRRREAPELIWVDSELNDWLERTKQRVIG